MTLPFRRRHHDNENAHDRARAILVGSFLEPSSSEDAAWYEGHLASCAECRVEHDAYVADRELLRGLRDRRPEPPRDLWARTATRLERESARRGRGPAPLPVSSMRRAPSAVPLGVLSGALVVLVLVATSLLGPGGGVPAPSAPPRSQVAVLPPASAPAATPLTVIAQPLGWIRQTADGSYQLAFAAVDRVCPDPRTTGCAPLDAGTTAPISLAAPPQAVVLSPTSEQLIVATGVDTSGGGDVLVVPVPQSGPTGGPTDSPTPSLGPSATPRPAGSPATTPSASATPRVTPTQTPGPTQSAAGSATAPAASASIVPSPLPTPAPTPDGSRAIASGIVLVGQPRYSPDGRWLAFSAHPLDGSTGPDLYLWRVGDALAERVTDDHGTYFAGWESGRVLASRVTLDGAPGPAGSPAVSGSPGGPSAAPTVPPARTTAPVPTSSAPASPADSGSSSPLPGTTETGRPSSFLLDPESRAEAPLPWQDMWQPTVDPLESSVVFWSGTLVRDVGSLDWRLGTGRVLLDSWAAAAGATASLTPDPNATPGMSSAPGASPPSGSSSIASPDGHPSPRPSLGAPGSTFTGVLATPNTSAVGASGPVVLADGEIGAFQARFDPTATRLALWTTDPASAPTPNVGLLRLLLVDPATSTVQAVAVDPLPGVPALADFSIDAGRLAWVTPPGQDGEGSLVRILAWSGDSFGQVETFPSEHLYVVR